MTNNIVKYIFIAFAAISLYACYPDVKAPAAPKGSIINVSTYVAIGNSITSGYADGALYYNGQLVSYPNLLAQQFKMIGGSSSFKQPLMPQNSVGVGSSGNARLVLGVVNGSLSPVSAAAVGDTAQFRNNIYASQGPFNNMGVPGAKAITVVFQGYGNPANGAGNFNPFFSRMASNPVTASMLSDAVSQKATFFSLFIGNNDVLAYALAGGASDSITSTADFNASIDAIVSAMIASGAKQGVVGNIPDIASLPFFTTIPYNPLTATAIGKGDSSVGKANIQALNTSLYGPLVQVLTAFGQGSRISLLSPTSANPLLIKDTTLTNLSAQITGALTPMLGAATASAFGQIYGQARQATAADYVLLTTQSAIGSTVAGIPAGINVNGISYPLGNQYILSQTEATAIQTARSAFNNKLQSAANANGLAYVDVAAFLQAAKTGLIFNGVTVSAGFVTGGAFSLDGIHLTPRGNALLANEFIKAINAKYQSSIPLVDVSSYGGVRFP